MGDGMNIYDHNGKKLNLYTLKINVDDINRSQWDEYIQGNTNSAWTISIDGLGEPTAQEVLAYSAIFFDNGN